VQEMMQGTQEWKALRKTKITGTDAPIIVGASHWKTRVQLYREKTGEDFDQPINERMQRGIDLEPVARDLFCMKTGLHVEPRVIVKDWAMASLDGIDSSGKNVVEIKCLSKKYHNEALLGMVPAHYFPQLQHQIFVAEVDKAYYFSFDGFDGVTVEVHRDDSFIKDMVRQEQEFYDCMMSKTPPLPTDADYLDMEYNPRWEALASDYKEVARQMRSLEEQQQKIREALVELSGQSNAKGAGLSLLQIQRKGAVDYARIPELHAVDLEKYRKDSSFSWRINS